MFYVEVGTQVLMNGAGSGAGGHRLALDLGNEFQECLFLVSSWIMFPIISVCSLFLVFPSWWVQCSQLHLLCCVDGASRNPQHAWKRKLWDLTSSAILIGWEGTCGPLWLWKSVKICDLSSELSPLVLFSDIYLNLRELFEIICSFSHCFW